ncbi:2-nitropropane dioxygenase [Mucilaginibacter sp. PPCGB 2223]|uniref:NAD(P)H-dependent flavin oxidoreductase n=1 Tax=Mucilaginibacter sp. PPCGB 2223 TaxID=1886027 RepID=UPI0008266DEB|nr:nitronate monooxygenase [Mucilaginibacter sp. PPCGB 2223]OCX53736.1 2-nitropropane dioxygenase [Mucilaginibacter sp. PPCGB 2223]
MWNKTQITELFGIDYPILLGPMGAGFSTPDLAAAVSNEGGLGSLGAYTFSPEQIRDTCKEIAGKTSKPYNINLWVSDVDAGLKNYPSEKLIKVKALFKPYFDELSIAMPDLDINIPSKFEDQAEVIFEAKPAVFSFIFGIPSKEIFNECRRLNIKTMGAATTLDEALALEEAGVDAIVAAGFEAGGHRPSFLRPALESLTGTFALLQQLKSQIKIPVIAAGGITDGKGVAAALTLGADAVQIGTAFLACDEANVAPAHRAMLLSGKVNHTVLSKSLTGRFGRMISNRIAAEVGNETDVLPFPLHNKFLAPLKAAAIAQGKNDLTNFWSGQNAGNLKHTKAAGLMQALITETNQILS